MLTKKEQLKKKYDEFQKLKFPSEPDGLDLIAELSEDDSYIGGNVMTCLGHASVEHPLLGVRKEIYGQLKGYKPRTEEDRGYFEYLKLYIDKLDELNKLLIECLDEVKIE